MSWKKKRLRTSGSIEDLKLKVWQAIVEAERMVIEGDTDNKKVQAIHALNSSAKTYLKIIEHADFEARLSTLETVLKTKQHYANQTHFTN